VEVGWLVVCDVVPEDAVVTSGPAGLQADSASAAPATKAANAAGLRFPMTVTETFLLVLMPDSASSLVSTSS
jgi:hypothetical protein